MRNPIIDQLTQESISKVSPRPEVLPGDTVSASLKIKEGDKERHQLFEGIVIAKRNRGIGSSITIRKISNGTYVERVIPLYSPILSKLEIIRHGKVRRSKLYYLRDLKGKATRIKEKFSKQRPTEEAA